MVRELRCVYFCRSFESLRWLIAIGLASVIVQIINIKVLLETYFIIFLKFVMMHLWGYEFKLQSSLLLPYRDLWARVKMVEFWPFFTNLPQIWNKNWIHSYVDPDAFYHNWNFHASRFKIHVPFWCWNFDTLKPIQSCHLIIWYILFENVYLCWN